MGRASLTCDLKGFFDLPLSVELWKATRENKVSLNTFDGNTMNPVGNKKIDKVTGKEAENIIKGFKLSKDAKPILFSDAEIKELKAKKGVETVGFRDSEQITPDAVFETYKLKPHEEHSVKWFSLLFQILKSGNKQLLVRCCIGNKERNAVVAYQNGWLWLYVLFYETEKLKVEKPEILTEADKEQLAQLEQVLMSLDTNFDGKHKEDSKDKLFKELIEQKAVGGDKDYAETIKTVKEQAKKETDKDLLAKAVILAKAKKKKGGEAV